MDQEYATFVFDVRDTGDDGHVCDDGEGVAWQMPRQILLIFVGSTVIYASLFAIGGLVYGNLTQGIVLGTIAAFGTYMLFTLMKKLKLD